METNSKVFKSEEPVKKNQILTTIKDFFATISSCGF